MATKLDLPTPSHYQQCMAKFFKWFEDVVARLYYIDFQDINAPSLRKT